MRRFGLRAQFILLIAILLTIIFTTIAVVLLRLNTKSLRHNLLNQTKVFAALATKPIGTTFITYQDSGQIRILQQVDKFTDLDTTISNVTIVDIKARQLFKQKDQPLDVSPGEAASFEPVFVNNKAGQLIKIVSPFLEDFGAHRYSVVYGVSNSTIDAQIQQLAGIILFFSLVALLATTILLYLLINRLFLNPLQRVSQMALVISAGHLDQKIELERRDEIADLANSVNIMAEALKADIVKLREVDELKSEFMMLVSHNLRTPLTAMKGSLENLQQLKLNKETLNIVMIVAASSSRLSAIAEDILTISQMETGEGSIPMQQEEIDLSLLLTGIIEEFRPLAAEKHLTIEARIEPKRCFANVSAARIRGAIWNLLDNALKFTDHGKIVLTLQAKGHAAIIGVADTGVGIAAAELPRLFTKFHRATSTLQYDYEGTGLGLYVTKLIVEKHGGTIRAASQLGQGSTFTITLPLIRVSNSS